VSGAYDHHPSLTVTEADNGLILMHCHAECSYDDICRALGISNIVATYDYCNEASKLLYQVTRTTPKAFFMRRPNGEDGFKNGLGDVRRVLYRLPDLLKTDRHQPVFIPEGEKDVDALHQLGLWFPSAWDIARSDLRQTLTATFWSRCNRELPVSSKECCMALTQDAKARLYDPSSLDPGHCFCSVPNFLHS